MTYELEEPFFQEKERITPAPKQIGDKTQVTFSSNGTFKGNIEVTNTGDLVSVSKGNKGMSAQGQGVVTTKDGSVASDSRNFFDVGFDDVNIYFSPPFILISSFEVVDSADPSAIIHR